MENIRPKYIQDLKVELEDFTKETDPYDITPAILEISIFESIYNSFLYGEIIVADNSAMLSTFPIIGEEKITISWERSNGSGEKIKKEFYVIGIFDVKQSNSIMGSYGITITSKKQLQNSISLFSKSYKGSGDEIIKKIYKEFLDEDIEIEIPSLTSHSIVFPYIKPLQACDMVRKNILAEDGTPFFLYEKFYSDPNKFDTILTSYKKMFDKPIIRDIKPSLNVMENTPNEKLFERGQIYDIRITKSYDTLSQISKGAFASTILLVDISDRRVENKSFSFRKHAPSVAKSVVSNFSSMDLNQHNISKGSKKEIHQIYETQNRILFKNIFSFANQESDKNGQNVIYPNLNSINALDKSIIDSYLTRLRYTTSVFIEMDSISYEKTDKGRGFGVGETVDLFFPKFSPNLKETDRGIDLVNSGKYIISTLRHFITRNEYKMSLELIRDGMGQEGSFGIEPEIDIEPRETIQIYEYDE
jgi:hypothetical protein